jgi:RNA polymerase sigma factor (sigma-70 family)
MARRALRWLVAADRCANMIVDRSKRGGREVAAVDDTPEPSTQVNLEEIDQSARLFRLVEQLPSDQRRVIGMRFAEEKSIREIAHELGRSEGAVKQLPFRALRNLRARMEGANA